MDVFLVLHDDEGEYDTTVLGWRVLVTRRLLEAVCSASVPRECQGDVCPDCKLLECIAADIRQLPDQGRGSFNTGFGFSFDVATGGGGSSGGRGDAAVPRQSIPLEISASIDWDGRPALVVQHRDPDPRG